MDYWHRLKLTVHDDIETFFRDIDVEARLWLFDSAGKQPVWDADFRDGDWLVFGNESRGIDPQILSSRLEQSVRIPQVAGERCLNLSTAAGIGLYTALGRICGRR